MSKNSKIEWTHHTFNPWWGCTKVSPGCKHCYAETWAKRLGQKVWGARAPRRELTSAYWKQPLAWNADAARTGRCARVFCASMADVFEDRRDLDVRRESLWALIENTPHLEWLLPDEAPRKCCAPGALDPVLAAECLARCNRGKSALARCTHAPPYRAPCTHPLPVV